MLAALNMRVPSKQKQHSSATVVNVSTLLVVTQILLWFFLKIRFAISREIQRSSQGVILMHRSLDISVVTAERRWEPRALHARTQ